jgi:hypothetical protein
VIYTIGVGTCGEVDELGDEWIATRFFIFGVPLLPLDSHFVRVDRSGYEPRLTSLPIPFHFRSALVGLMWGAGGFGVGMMVLITGIIPLADLIQFHPALMLLPVGWGALIVLVRLFARQNTSSLATREQLLRATGTSALPEYLPFELRHEILGQLRASPRVSSAEWRAATSAYERALR